MKKKENIIAITALISGFLFGLLLINKCTNNQDIINNIKEVNKSDSTQFYKDKFGYSHAQLQQVILTSQASELLFKNKLDSQAKILGIKSRNIADYTNIIASHRGSTIIVLHDSAIYNIHDTTLQYSLIHDTLTVSWVDSIPLGINRYFKQLGVNWLPNFINPFPKYWFLNVYSPDSSVSITKLQNIHIDNENSRFALGCFVGLNIFPKLQPSVGFSLNYNIFYFKKSKQK